MYNLNRLKIIADDKIPFLHGVLEPYADVVYLPGKEITQKAIAHTDALLIRTRTICNKSLLDGSTIKFIATATIGFDHIDTEYCRLNSIKWVNAPGCNSSSVQQYVIAALVEIAEQNNYNLSEKTMGIVGVGNVGSKVQKAAEILGMRILLNDPPRARQEGPEGFVSLQEILETSDIVSIHVPYTRVGEDKTEHLFNDRTLNNMKSGAWLINTSRGEVVQTSSLIEALSSEKIAGVVLDVWENEPEINQQLLRKTMISTPHIAGYSADGKANGTAMVVQALSDFFDFPLKAFYPSTIPEPAVKEICIQGKGKTVFQVVKEAVLQSYPILADHMNLQQAPQLFEHLRSNYPVRREFPAFTIRLIDGDKRSVEALKQLGFKIV